MIFYNDCYGFSFIFFGNFLISLEAKMVKMITKKINPSNKTELN